MLWVAASRLHLTVLSLEATCLHHSPSDGCGATYAALGALPEPFTPPHDSVVVTESIERLLTELVFSGPATTVSIRWEGLGGGPFDLISLDSIQRDLTGIRS